MRAETGTNTATRKKRPAPTAVTPLPVAALVPPRSTTRASSRPPVWALVPGAQLASGRYRLLERCGGTADTAFWRAHDTVLARDVALTVVDFPAAAAVDAPSGGGAASYFDRTGWLCRVRSEAVAAVLDMFEVDGRAVVVAQWKQGHPLGQMGAGTPADAAASVVPLAQVLCDAHRDGAVAALDHPSRVRVGADGVSYLAFPGVSAEADARGDVRGLGNVLSELLTGMHHTGDGRPLSPSAVRPDVSPELAELVVRAVGSGDLTATSTAEALLGVVAEAPRPEPEPGSDPTPSGVVATEPDADGPRTFRQTWGPYLAGGVLLVVLATIGWFVGVSLI